MIRLKEDIYDAPTNIKEIAISFFSLPFWYISLFIFHRDFYNSSSVTLILAFCFCFIITAHGLLSFSIDLSNIHTPEKQLSKKEIEENAIQGSLAATFIQTTLLMVIISAGYIWNLIFGYIFFYYGFLFVYFGIVLSFLGIMLLISYRYKKSRKSTNSKK